MDDSIARMQDAAQGFDEGRLNHWLARNVEGYAGPLTVEKFAGGQSNPTFRLTTPGRSYVLRRKPAGKLIKGAHAIEREARIIEALAGSGVPVPRIFGLCTDDAVIGSWFYVMELVEGRIFWDAAFPDVEASRRAEYFRAMNETLARLHSIDPAALGLSDFGRAGNYFERQIKRWTKTYLDDRDAGRDPNLDRLIEWLPSHIPAGDETSIIHGDFRCDNLIFHPTEPRILAVLDWELSTLGHPGADFAYHSMMYRMPPHIVAGLAGVDLARGNIPDEASYVAQYCTLTGREAMPDYDYFLAFNFFRLAAIFHGIKARMLRGSASSAQARDRVRVLPELAALAWDQAVRAGAAGS